MRAHRPTLAVLLALAACRRSAPEAQISRDPSIADATPPPIDAAPRERLPSEAPVARVVRHGVLFDQRDGRVVTTLSKGMPAYETSDATAAYLAGSDGVLRVYDLEIGLERSIVKLGFVPRIGSDDEASIFLPHDEELAVLTKRDGSLRTWRYGANVSRAVPLGARVVVQLGDRDLEIVDVASGVTATRVTLPFSLLGWRAALVADRAHGGFCAIGHDPTPLEIACFDAAGAPRYRTHVALAKPGDPSSASFQLRAVGPRYVLFGTLFFGGGVRRAAVVRLSDGVEIARVEEEIAAVIERDDGSVEGLLATQPEVKLVELSGKTRWNAGKLAPYEEGASAFARDGRVYASIYPPISSGSALYAFDAASGKVAWKGDVEQLPIAHSEYFNETTLAWFEGNVVLRGEESSVSTFQVFRAGDGKRLLADSRNTW
jgi:hypothetical protein